MNIRVISSYTALSIVSTSMYSLHFTGVNVGDATRAKIEYFRIRTYSSENRIRGIRMLELCLNTLEHCCFAHHVYPSSSSSSSDQQQQQQQQHKTVIVQSTSVLYRVACRMKYKKWELALHCHLGSPIPPFSALIT